MSPKACARGFSLIELSIVLALIALVLGISISFKSLYRHALVKSELHRLHMVCALLQQKACGTGIQQTLSFDSHTHCYAYNNVQHQLPGAILLGFIPGVKGPPSSPRYAIVHPLSNNVSKIIFFPTGIMQPVTVYFKNREQTMMYALSVGVAHTSFVRKYIFDGAWNLIH